MFTDYYAQQSCTAGTRGVYPWTDSVPYRFAEGWPAGRGGETQDSDPTIAQASSLLATQRRRSVKIILATVTNTFRRYTVSTSFMASSITSTG